MSDREAAQGEGAGAAASIVRHGYLSITDITDRGMIDLQIAEPETALVEVVSEALGAVLPADAHHSSSNGSLTILGRGPGHWVISCPASETARWTGRLETAIAGNLPTAPALMGNTVVWKPSPTQTFAVQRMACSPYMVCSWIG